MARNEKREQRDADDLRDLHTKCDDLERELAKCKDFDKERAKYAKKIEELEKQLQTGKAATDLLQKLRMKELNKIG